MTILLEGAMDHVRGNPSPMAPVIRRSTAKTFSRVACLRLAVSRAASGGLKAHADEDMVELLPQRSVRVNMLTK